MGGGYSTHCKTRYEKCRSKTSTHPRLVVLMNILHRYRAHTMRCRCGEHSPIFSIFEYLCGIVSVCARHSVQPHTHRSISRIV